MTAKLSASSYRKLYELRFYCSIMAELYEAAQDEVSLVDMCFIDKDGRPLSPGEGKSTAFVSAQVKAKGQILKLLSDAELKLSQYEEKIGVEHA